MIRASSLAAQRKKTVTNYSQWHANYEGEKHPLEVVESGKLFLCGSRRHVIDYEMIQTFGGCPGCGSMQVVDSPNHKPSTWQMLLYKRWKVEFGRIMSFVPRMFSLKEIKDVP